VTPEILEEMIDLRNRHTSVKDIALKYGLNQATVSIKLKGKCEKNRVRVVSKDKPVKKNVKMPEDFTTAPNDMFFDFRKFPGI
jgi:hypothetical protein